LALSPNVGASHVDQEGFWKREAFNKFGESKNKLNEHGVSWKRLNFEKCLYTLLGKQSHEDGDDDINSMVRLRNPISIDIGFTVFNRAKQYSCFCNPHKLQSGIVHAGLHIYIEDKEHLQ